MEAASKIRSWAVTVLISCIAFYLYHSVLTERPPSDPSLLMSVTSVLDSVGSMNQGLRVRTVHQVCFLRDHKSRFVIAVPGTSNSTLGLKQGDTVTFLVSAERQEDLAQRDEVFVYGVTIDNRVMLYPTETLRTLNSRFPSDRVILVLALVSLVTLVLVRRVRN
jgi:hypothetical protein